jgi:DNA polymerase I
VLEQFREVVLVDFEFSIATTGRPEPVCLVAHELHSGRTLRLWRNQFGPVPPYGTGPDTLFVAFFASAELGCHRALGWPSPIRILDLFTEFRDRFNGLETKAGNSLLGALTQFGLDSIGAEEKQDMRELILGGGPWSAEQRNAILDYCESDVVALRRLLPAMLPGIDIPHALLRGRYMAAVAAMEHNGVPIDLEKLALLRDNWEAIQDDLIAAIDCDYGVYDGHTFKMERTGWSTTTFPGRGWRVASSISKTTPSASRREPIRLLRRCGSCAARWLSCGWRTLLPVRMGVIDHCYRRSGHVPGEISRATQSLSLVPVRGYAA